MKPALIIPLQIEVVAAVEVAVAYVFHVWCWRAVRLDSRPTIMRFDSLIAGSGWPMSQIF